MPQPASNHPADCAKPADRGSALLQITSDEHIYFKVKAATSCWKIERVILASKAVLKLGDGVRIYNGCSPFFPHLSLQEAGIWGGTVLDVMAQQTGGGGPAVSFADLDNEGTAPSSRCFTRDTMQH